MFDKMSNRISTQPQNVTNRLGCGAGADCQINEFVDGMKSNQNAILPISYGVPSCGWFCSKLNYTHNMSRVYNTKITIEFRPTLVKYEVPFRSSSIFVTHAAMTPSRKTIASKQRIIILITQKETVYSNVHSPRRNGIYPANSGNEIQLCVCISQSIAVAATNVRTNETKNSIVNAHRKISAIVVHSIGCYIYIYNTTTLYILYPPSWFLSLSLSLG